MVKQSASVHFSGPLGGIGNSMLSAFGIKHVEGAPATHLEKVEKHKRLHKGLSLPILLWLGARLPFAAFATIVGMFTYMYHIHPIAPWVLVFLSLDFAIIVCWPAKMIGTKHRTFWDWGPMYSWFLAISLGTILGLLNYGILESWVNTAFLREYSDVLPTADASTVSDAGVLKFAKGTRLDTESAAGYKFWFYNYCAAPIVGTDPSAAPITFWAVGVGCCSSRGEFTCDSASDKSVQSAMPLRPHTLGPEITSHYNQAIRMAASANDLEASKEPIFVLWQKDPKAVGKYAWWVATLLFLGSVLLALCSCCACQSGFMHMDAMQH